MTRIYTCPTGELPLPLRPEHNFKISREEWEFAVFDRAQLFVVLHMRSQPRYKRVEYDDLAAALDYAREQQHVCLYAVAPSERNILLTPKRWPEWLERFQQRAAQTK